MSRLSPPWNLVVAAATQDNGGGTRNYQILGGTSSSVFASWDSVGPDAVVVSPRYGSHTAGTPAVPTATGTNTWDATEGIFTINDGGTAPARQEYSDLLVSEVIYVNAPYVTILDSDARIFIVDQSLTWDERPIFGFCNAGDDFGVAVTAEVSTVAPGVRVGAPYNGGTPDAGDGRYGANAVITGGPFTAYRMNIRGGRVAASFEGYGGEIYESWIHDAFASAEDPLNDFQKSLAGCLEIVGGNRISETFLYNTSDDSDRSGRVSIEDNRIDCWQYQFGSGDSASYYDFSSGSFVPGPHWQIFGGNNDADTNAFMFRVYLEDENLEGAYVHDVSMFGNKVDGNYFYGYSFVRPDSSNIPNMSDVTLDSEVITKRWDDYGRLSLSHFLGMSPATVFTCLIRNSTGASILSLFPDTTPCGEEPVLDQGGPVGGEGGGTGGGGGSQTFTSGALRLGAYMSAGGPYPTIISRLRGDYESEGGINRKLPGPALTLGPTTAGDPGSWTNWDNSIPERFNEAYEWVVEESRPVMFYLSPGSGFASAPRVAAHITVEEVANGDHNSHFELVGQHVNDIFGSKQDLVMIRPFWELDGSWYWWGLVNPDSTHSPADLAEAYRQVVDSIRVHATTVKFVWGIIGGHRAPNLATTVQVEAAYPGNNYVDFIDYDPYDRSWGETQDQRIKGWDRLIGDPARDVVGDTTNTALTSISWLRNFGAAKGKKLIFSEWGANKSDSGNRGGDNTYYLENMIATINEMVDSGELEWHMYFEQNKEGTVRALHPFVNSPDGVSKNEFLPLCREVFDAEYRQQSNTGGGGGNPGGDGTPPSGPDTDNVALEDPPSGAGGGVSLPSGTADILFTLNYGQVHPSPYIRYWGDPIKIQDHETEDENNLSEIIYSERAFLRLSQMTQSAGVFDWDSQALEPGVEKFTSFRDTMATSMATRGVQAHIINTWMPTFMANTDHYAYGQNREGYLADTAQAKTDYRNTMKDIIVHYHSIMSGDLVMEAYNEPDVSFVAVPVGDAFIMYKQMALGANDAALVHGGGRIDLIAPAILHPKSSGNWWRTWLDLLDGDADRDDIIPSAVSFHVFGNNADLEDIVSVAHQWRQDLTNKGTHFNNTEIWISAYGQRGNATGWKETQQATDAAQDGSFQLAAFRTMWDGGSPIDRWNYFAQSNYNDYEASVILPKPLAIREEDEFGNRYAYADWWGPGRSTPVGNIWRMMEEIHPNSGDRVVISSSSGGGVSSSASKGLGYGIIGHRDTTSNIARFIVFDYSDPPQSSPSSKKVRINLSNLADVGIGDSVTYRAWRVDHRWSNVYAGAHDAHHLQGVAKLGATGSGTKTIDVVLSTNSAVLVEIKNG